MFMLPITRRAIGRFISWLPRLLFFTTTHFRQHMSEGFIHGPMPSLTTLPWDLKSSRTPQRSLPASCFQLVYGCSPSFILYFILGCKGVNITFLQASASIIIMCFFIMLPSVPGYWGIWEVGGIYGLMIFGVPKMEAAGLTLTYHFFQIIPLILVGLLSSWLTGVNIMQAGLHSQEGIPKE